MENKHVCMSTHMENVYMCISLISKVSYSTGALWTLWRNEDDALSCDISHKPGRFSDIVST